MIKQLFVNLPVMDLQRSKEFFGALGFSYNASFTNEKAACLILGEGKCAMLLMQPFFNSFLTHTEISDARKVTEVLIALQVEHREKVDELVACALRSGGAEARMCVDMGWMYSKAFADPDGHIWEVFCMDEAGMPAA